MTNKMESSLSCEVLDDDTEFSLVELCEVCQVPADAVVALVTEGVVEPIGQEQTQWRFRAVSVKRVRCAIRLEHDLGINVAGVALALDLLDELEHTRERLKQLDSNFSKTSFFK